MSIEIWPILTKVSPVDLCLAATSYCALKAHTLAYCKCKVGLVVYSQVDKCSVLLIVIQR